MPGVLEELLDGEMEGEILTDANLFLLAAFVVIPLVMAIVFGGVARLGDTRSLGRLGGTALAFIFGTTLIGVLTGMGAMGLALQFIPEVANPGGASPDAVDLPGITDFLVGLVPRNPFEAATPNQGSARREKSGLDVVLPYWMGRFHGAF